MCTADNKTTNVIFPAFMSAGFTCENPEVCMLMSDFIAVCNQGKVTQPAKIHYKDKYTTVVWEDGTATTVCCGENEAFDKYSGFCAAACKKFFGSTTHVKRMIEILDVEENKRKACEAKAKAKAEAMEAAAAARARNEEKIIKRAVKRHFKDLEMSDKILAAIDAEKSRRDAACADKIQIVK